MAGCPGSTEAGCRCPEHHPGLGAYSPDPVAYEAALARVRPIVTLRVVTLPPDDRPACDGTMTCSCEVCVRERVSRPSLGAGPARFRVKPARPRAA